MTKPAYFVSFLLSINIFVCRNVLYFPKDTRISKDTRGNDIIHFGVQERDNKKE